MFIRHFTRPKFDLFCLQFNEFLCDYDIHCGVTDIFEDTVLALADIKIKPERCYTDTPQRRNSNVMHMQLTWEASPEDKTKLLAFLRKFDESVSLSSNNNVDIFELNIEKIRCNLLPLIYVQIKKMSDTNSTLLANYKQQSQSEHEEIEQIKITRGRTLVAIPEQEEEQDQSPRPGR